MNLNPVEIIRLKTQMKAFQKEHPKFTAFLRYCAENRLEADNVLDVTVRTPNGDQTHANLRLSENDAQLLKSLRALLSGTEYANTDGSH